MLKERRFNVLISALPLTNNGSLLSKPSPFGSFAVSRNTLPMHMASRNARWLNTHHTFASLSKSSYKRKKVWMAS